MSRFILQQREFTYKPYPYRRRVTEWTKETEYPTYEAAFAAMKAEYDQHMEDVRSDYDDEYIEGMMRLTFGKRTAKIYEFSMDDYDSAEYWHIKEIN